MREQGLDGTGTIKGSAQGFIQDYEMGGGGGGGQNGSRQWRSQDIAIARAQHGHTLYELPHEVQKLIGGSGGILPPPPRKFRNSTVSHVSSEAIYCSEV